MEGTNICARLKNLLAFPAITTSWLPSGEQTIQHKQRVPPLPEAAQRVHFTWLISQEQGNLEMQFYLPYNSFYRGSEMAATKYF